MKKSFIIVLAGALMLTGCKDMLDLKPQGQFTSDQIDASAIEGLLASAYAGLEAHFFGNNEAFAGPSTNWIFDVRSDDALKGGGGVSMEANIHQYEVSNIFSDNVSGLDKWKNNYFALSRVHSAMNTLEEAKVDNKDQYMGELKVLRAFYYFDLVKIFKYLPYLEPKSDVNTVGNDVYSQQDIYGFIINDLTEAYGMMDENAPSRGRFNRYAAAALLARAYAFRASYIKSGVFTGDAEADWKKCREYAGYVIDCHKYDLYPNYLDMSKIDNNNMYESIIALQCSTADDNAHINWSNLLNVTYSTGNYYGTGDDFFYASQNLADAFRTDANGFPLVDATGVDHIAAGYTGNVDPRLDFTMGRIGVPFRGNEYTEKWCRAQDVYGEFSSKKNCIDPTDERMAKGWPWGASPLNFCFLRYAEVILLKAEAEAELGNDGEALNLVNDIRNKAKRSIDTNYRPLDLDFTGTNYKVEPYTAVPAGMTIVDVVRLERRLELAMEGHRWFDLVRWGIAVETMNKFFTDEAEFHTYYAGANCSADELYLPTPLVEQQNSNGLYKK